MKRIEYKAFTYSLIGLILIVLVLSVQNCAGGVPVDKKLHIGAGAFCSTWGTWVGSVYYPDRPLKSSIIGFSIALTAGIGKEALDHVTGGRAEFKDLQYTILGGVVGALASYGVMKLVQKKHRKRIFALNY